MDWDDLRIFLAVVRGRTLIAAGRQLSLDATTVARRLARFEERIGRSLFEVTPNGHILTSRGNELLGHAQAMESAALAALEGSASAEQPTGTIRVSVSEGFGTWVIAPNLKSFSAKHPDIAVELVASTGFLNPSRREADLAIMLARPKRGPLIASKLTDYRLGLYVATEPDDPAPIVELNSAPLVGYVPDLIYAPELDYLNELAPGLRPTLTSTSVNAQAALIASGAGVGVLPCFIGDADPRLTRIRRKHFSLQRSFYLVVHRDLRRIRRVSLFVEWLQNMVTGLKPLLQGERSDKHVLPPSTL
ncbi:MAG TPA: LysR family transcriptional regulator [Sphingomonas sp.]|nr:LysR family transcriptional regulator [Sphingomonas sp.]